MLLVALALAGAPVTASKEKAQPDSPPSQMQKLLENCDAHKFETFIEVKVEGQPLPKRSRVKLCGTEGQSDSDWVRTLKDAVMKTEANLRMPPAVREQIVTALNAEISRLNGGSAALPPPRQSSKTSALDGLSALPPLPEPKQAETAAMLPPPRMIAPRSSSQDYAALPPMPTTVTAPTRVLTGSLGASLPALPKPRMEFACFIPGETEEGPCTGFTRDYSWIDMPIVGPDGFPRHDGGVVLGQHGLYFVGLPYQTRLASGFVGGVGRDASAVAEVIAGRLDQVRRPVPAGLAAMMGTSGKA